MRRVSRTKQLSVKLASGFLEIEIKCKIQPGAYFFYGLIKKSVPLRSDSCVRVLNSNKKELSKVQLF